MTGRSNELAMRNKKELPAKTGSSEMLCSNSGVC